MRTFFAALSGLLAAGGLVSLVMLGTEPGSIGLLILLLVLSAIAAASLFGGFIVAKIQTSSRAISAFAVLQLFFTLAVLSWRSPLPGWFRLLALLIVVPAATLGGKLAGAPVSELPAQRNTDVKTDRENFA